MPMEGLHLDIAPVQADLKPVCSNVRQCWCVKDHWAYRFDYETQHLRKVFRIPRKSDGLAGRAKDVLARSWIRHRFWPGVDIDNLVELPNQHVLIIFDRVYWYSPDHHDRFAEVLPANISPPMAAPLRGGVAVHAVSQCAYFGEYLNGHHRDIRVCRVNVAKRLVEPCWSFSRSEIKHIHAIHYDRFRNRLWICTGDLDRESAFYFTDDEFRTVHRFAGGDQSWRAIAVLFDETGMEWGMDAGKDAPADAINRIYRYDFASGQRTELAAIGNPAYAACEFDDGTALIQTSFEPGRRQDTPESVALWFRGDNRTWQPCFSLPYRPGLRAGARPYGHLLLPSGVSPAGQVLCTAVNTATLHDQLLRLSWAPTGR